MTTHRVFVSHTSDMATHPPGRSFVQAALDATNRAGFAAVDMRYFAAREGQPASYCQQRVRECEIFVAVVGLRYGSLVPGETISYIDLEFREATVSGKPRLVFLLDDGLDLPPDLVDDDRVAVDGFRRRLRAAGLIVATFTSADSLELELFHALQETARSPHPVVPHQLPAAVSHFVGRSEELDTLTAQLGEQAAAGQMAISVVGGVAGAGKTALAICAAHRVAARFPDGQLYVDLRGFDAGEPLQASAVLAQFLASLGVRDVPVELPDRAAQFRSAVSGRRILVVLDNAASSEQVRPLLPGTGSCGVLVTSRDSLAGLVARNGARRLHLAGLSHTDACLLLAELIGARTVGCAPTVAQLATQCGHLPLALRIAAERALSRPAMALTDLVAELSDEQHRLDVLQADPDTAVRTVFSWSYRQLDTASARLFRLLGLHPGVAIDTSAAAALADTDRDQARRMMDTLCRGYLVEPAGPSHFGLHDLLRAYAAQLAATHDGPAVSAAALARLLDYYVATAAHAMEVAFPESRRPHPEVLNRATTTPRLADPGQATAWLAAERRNLVHATVYAARHGWPAHATTLGAVLFFYLIWHDDHLADTVTVYEAALQAARSLGDSRLEADALLSLGRVYHARWNRPREALKYHQQALEIMRHRGDQDGTDSIMGSLGAVHMSLGHMAAATNHLHRALAVARTRGDQWAQAIHLENLASIDWTQGRRDEAVTSMWQCVAMLGQHGDQGMRANAMLNLAEMLSERGLHDEAMRQAEQARAMLFTSTSRIDQGMADLTVGTILGRLGHHEQAMHHYERALAIHEEHGVVAGLALARNGIGQIHLAAGRPIQAVSQHRQALTIFSARGLWNDHTATLNLLGAALLAAGQQDEALHCHQQAIDMASATGNRYQVAKGLSASAAILHSRGEIDLAQTHAATAAAILAQLGLPANAGP